MSEYKVKMQDGDIFTWRWTDEEKKRRLESFGAGYLSIFLYHCFSRIAIFEENNLYDTFWVTGKSKLAIEGVALEFQGNAHEMKEISKYDNVFYNPSDIVDMRHSNSSNAKIYLKKDAKRCALTMRNHAMSRRAESIEELSRRRVNIDHMDEILSMLDDGMIDEVSF